MCAKCAHADAKAVMSSPSLTNHTSTAAATTTPAAAKFADLELSELARNWLARASASDCLRFQRKMSLIAEFAALLMAGHATDTNKGRTKKMKGSKKANLWRTKLDKGCVRVCVCVCVRVVVCVGVVCVLAMITKPFHPKQLQPTHSL